MRKIEIGTNRFTEVFSTDEKSFGGAYHGYVVTPSQPVAARVSEEPFAVIHFQKGPIEEAGVNGCHNEDLIAIVIDRLQAFQEGEYACRENALAIMKLEEAMHWLNHRTQERATRGVEGTSEK